MRKSQAAYLTSLLSEAGEDLAPSPVPASEPSKSMTLLARDSALARVATGEVKQVTQLLLDPARVRIWKDNPRHQGALTEETCRDLIDAILAEGGQKVPAIVRRVSGDPIHEYEVIAGSRRHWAISWLRANSYPEMQFLAQVYNLDDEAAFRLSDIENRARKDVSDFERAKTYLNALATHYAGKQVKMAERLKVSKGWLSKLLTVASMPDWAVDAFASPQEIQLKTCYPLAQKIQNLLTDGHSVEADKIKGRAQKVAAEQAERKAAGKPGLPVSEVLLKLASEGEEENQEESALKFDMPSGRTALSVLSSNRNGVSVRLHAGSGASEAELVRMLRSALHELDKRGKGLRL